MSIIKLIDRLSKFEAEMRALPGNKVPKCVARPSLTATFRLTQAELVAAFGAKRPSDLSRNVRKAILVVARVHRGIDSHSVIADKAEVLGDRLAQLHGIVPVTHKASSPVDHAARSAEAEADRVRDMRRLERLADEAERRDLLAQCEKLQPECWRLACQLDRTDTCPVLPLGFRSLSEAELRRLLDALVKTSAFYAAKIAERVRIADEKRVAEAKAKADAQARAAEAKARIDALRQKYSEAQSLIRGLVEFAGRKRVRIERIVLPPIETLDDAKLDTFIAKLKGFRLKIEERARELDPVKTRHRIINPSALASPIAA